MSYGKGGSSMPPAPQTWSRIPGHAIIKDIMRDRSLIRTNIPRRKARQDQ